MNKPEPPSNRAFGNLFAGVFALLALYLWWNGKSYILPAIAGVAFFVIGLFVSHWLTPLNRAWMGLGSLLHRVVSPIVLGVMYFGLVTPYGLVMRIFRDDPLRRKFEPGAKSYWIQRAPPGPPPESLANQY